MTLRETIKKALGDKWTKELEDDLFWPISYWVTNAVALNQRHPYRAADGEPCPCGKSIDDPIHIPL